MKTKTHKKTLRVNAGTNGKPQPDPKLKNQKNKKKDKETEAGHLRETERPEALKKEEDQITNQDHRITNQEDLITKD